MLKTPFGAPQASVARTCLVGPQLFADQHSPVRFTIASARHGAQIDRMSRLRGPFLYDRYFFVSVNLLRSRRKLEERDFTRLGIALAAGGKARASIPGVRQAETPAAGRVLETASRTFRLALTSTPLQAGGMVLHKYTTLQPGFEPTVFSAAAEEKGKKRYQESGVRGWAGSAEILHSSAPERRRARRLSARSSQ